VKDEWFIERYAKYSMPKRNSENKKISHRFIHISFVRDIKKKKNIITVFNPMEKCLYLTVLLLILKCRKE